MLERKAPPTFDVIVEIQDRERVMVHADVAETVDAMLRGDPVAAEQRWKDEGGVHKSQSRPRPSPREQLGRDQVGRERFSGLVGSGGGGWRTEPAWRGTGDYRTTPWDPAGSARPGYRPGASGGWRESRGRAGEPGGRTLPGERIARHDERGGRRARAAARGRAADRGPAAGRLSTRRWTGPADGRLTVGRVEAPFVVGEIADRGPVERAAAAEAALDGRAREAREWERQAEWRDQAARALEAFKAEAGTGPANVVRLARPADESHGPRPVPTSSPTTSDSRTGRSPRRVDEDGPALRVESGILPTLRVYPYGISRKRLEQAVKELQLPVIVARLVDEADVVMTLRSEYRQKGPTIREAEDLALPVYVLKANTIVQMQASLTSIFALEVDPREAALRETEEAIGLVAREAQPVELAPQNAYVRRLQHQMAERANVVSRSRGREPYRRVRLYPDEARTWR